MKLSIDEIKKVAKLSKLKFSEEELVKFKNQFENILDFIADIENIEGIESTDIIYKDAETELREDIVNVSFEGDKVVRESAEHEDNCFVVPGAIE